MLECLTLSDVSLAYVEMLLLQTMMSWVAGALCVCVCSTSDHVGLLLLMVFPGFLRVSGEEASRSLSLASLATKLLGTACIIFAMLRMNGKI
jgi:hypothetical protein